MRQVSSLALGVVGAAVAMEVALRLFASAQGPPTPNIESDSLFGDTLVRRQLGEGVSLARFSVAGARLTGNPSIPGAPTVVLLGDSYVVAAAVADHETMGSYLERDARAAGVALNVRQYGWTGASPSRYLLEADSVIRRWNPAEVVIALGDNDFDHNALHEASPRLQVLSSGDLQILPAPPVAIPGPPRRSVLLALLAERTWRLQWRQARAAAAKSRVDVGAGSAPADADVLPDSLQLAMLPDAVVRALAAKFGPRLSLVYLAELGVDDGVRPATIERRLLDACAREQVRCVTTRPAMLAARRSGIIAHGFFNTTPGNGHLNPAGHAVVGAEMWKLLHRRPPQTFAGEVR
ncbi:MAG TPA: hypothetical protein VGQ44_05080 [Gemmatimonadaceae bacterium]|nr:hypothetical protein [Gemmatimonadaceae bacterium]